MTGRVGIIAGGGELPLAVAKALASDGGDPLLLPIRGEGTAAEEFASRPIPWGGFGDLFRLLEREGVRQIVFAGAIHRRPGIANARIDWTTLKKLPRLLHLLTTGDDTILSGVATLFEEAGYPVRGIADVAPDLLARTGVQGSIEPSERSREQIGRGTALLDAIGPHDVGQAVVVCGRRVVAVEGVEGTDRMVERVADMRRVGRLPQRADGVLVKCAKPGQDLRFDLPTIGHDTIVNARAAGLRGIAVEAGRSIILGRSETVAAADRHELFVYGWQRDAL